MKTTKFKAVHLTKTPSGSPIVVAVLKGPDGHEQRITFRPRQAVLLAVELERKGRLADHA